MVAALLDPAILIPPSDHEGAIREWMRQLRRWSQFFSRAAVLVRPLMPESSHACVATGGCFGEIRKALEMGGIDHVRPGDLLKLIDAIQKRAAIPEEELDPAELEFKTIVVNPEYVSLRLDACEREVFIGYIAHLLLAGSIEHRLCAVITDRPSWSSEADAVTVNAAVEVWVRGDETAEVPPEHRNTEGRVPLWFSPAGVDRMVEADWRLVLDVPKLAAEVASRVWVTTAEGGEQQVGEFKFGPHFVSSLKAMGYGAQSGRVAAVYKAIVHIASGRQDSLNSLNPHPRRRSAASQSAPITREGDEARLMSGHLSTGAAAHRLYWWEGAEPVFLGVLDHDDDPNSLTGGT